MPDTAFIDQPSNESITPSSLSLKPNYLFHFSLLNVSFLSLNCLLHSLTRSERKRDLHLLSSLLTLQEQIWQPNNAILLQSHRLMLTFRIIRYRRNFYSWDKGSVTYLTLPPRRYCCNHFMTWVAQLINRSTLVYYSSSKMDALFYNICWLWGVLEAAKF